MQSNVVVVTQPDLYFADQPSILTIGCVDYDQTIIDNIRRLEIPVTIYQSNENTDLEWIINAYNSSELTILNCQHNPFLTGFFIDKQHVYYYNNKESYIRFNFNTIADPMDVLIKWMAKWHIENPEKNAVLL